MPRNGSGTYSKPAGTTAIAGSRATASKYNELADDMATAMTDSLSRTGQGGMTADLAMGTHKVTGLAAPSAGSDAATKTYADGLQTTQAGYARGTASWGGTAAGTADALTVTLSPVPGAYASGLLVRFIAASTNTGAATLNANALGAIALRKPDGTTALTAGDVIIGLLYEAVYVAGSPNIFRLIKRETLPTVQVFAANGTWTRPVGCKKAKVTVVAGGGGGGGADSDGSTHSGAGGGGGGGGHSIELLDVSALASAAVVVGAAGTAGTNAGGNGGTGGTSSFGTGPLLQATGGAGGTGSGTSTSTSDAVAGGAGGTGSGGDVNGIGTAGAPGFWRHGDFAVGGMGGSSNLGGGGSGVRTSALSSTAGGAGGAFGGGGGGAADQGTATGAAGGAGAAGGVIVEEFY